jgi:hypothetical protein
MFVALAQARIHYIRLFIIPPSGQNCKGFGDMTQFFGGLKIWDRVPEFRLPTPGELLRAAKKTKII